MQKYSSWRRGAPAKGVGRETGARVRVSPSAPEKGTCKSKCFFQFLSHAKSNQIRPQISSFSLDSLDFFCQKMYSLY